MLLRLRSYKERQLRRVQVDVSAASLIDALDDR
jgi:hypothetical protein